MRSTPMATEQKVHDAVSDAYAKAVTRPADPQSCCSAPAQKGTVVKIAGYDRQELEALTPASPACSRPAT